MGELVIGPSQLELEDLELSTPLTHLVEDRVEQLRIDKVANGLDDLGVFRRCSSSQLLN